MGRFRRPALPVVAGANYHAWRRENAVFEDLGAFVTRGVTLAGEAPERVRAALAGFLPALRAARVHPVVALRHE